MCIRHLCLAGALVLSATASADGALVARYGFVQDGSDSGGHPGGPFHCKPIGGAAVVEDPGGNGKGPRPALCLPRDDACARCEAPQLPPKGDLTACDVRNNVICLTHGYTNGGEGRINHVANYTKRPNMRAADGTFAFLFFYPDRCAAGYLHASGNVVEGAGPQNQGDVSLFGIARFDNKPYVEFIAAKRRRTEKCPPYVHVDPAGIEKFLSPEPLAVPAEAAVTTDRAEEAYRKVLAAAGAILPRRDAADSRIAKDVEAGTGEIINSPKEIGGYPELKSAPPPADSDNDGMPDAWETQHGLNPKDPSEGSRDNDGDGHTNLEEYLNGTNPAGRDPS